MSDKYIIRNCPSFYRDFCGADDTDYFCCDETDCVMKRIVEMCKETLEQENDPINALEMSFAQKILKLLDIQEVE